MGALEESLLAQPCIQKLLEFVHSYLLLRYVSDKSQFMTGNHNFWEAFSYFQMRVLSTQLSDISMNFPLFFLMIDIFMSEFWILKQSTLKAELIQDLD